MTPKEKANELADKYYDLNYGYDGVCRMDWAKDGASIAVDEILYVVSKYNDTQAEVTYWQEVKEEIEKPRQL